MLTDFSAPSEFTQHCVLTEHYRIVTLGATVINYALQTLTKGNTSKQWICSYSTHTPRLGALHQNVTRSSSS